MYREIAGTDERVRAIPGVRNRRVRATKVRLYVVLFDLVLYVSVNNLSVTSRQVFLGSTSTKLGLMCLAQGHNAVMRLRLEPLALWSRVKHSTTEPLRSLKNMLYIAMYLSNITILLSQTLVNLK